MITLLMNLKSYLRDEKGQGMVEYGLILALIAIVVIAAVTGIGQELLSKFTEIGDTLQNAGTTTTQ